DVGGSQGDFTKRLFWIVRAPIAKCFARLGKLLLVEQIEPGDEFRHWVESRCRSRGGFLCGNDRRRKQRKESQYANSLVHYSLPNQNRPGKNRGLPAIAARYSGLAKSTLSSTARRCEMV